MDYNEIFKNIRLLSNNQQPTQDISELLSRHNCNFLLKRYHKFDVRNEALNKIFINERYKACKNIFEAFEKSKIPYAVIKEPFCQKWLTAMHFAGTPEILIYWYAKTSQRRNIRK